MMAVGMPHSRAAGQRAQRAEGPAASVVMAWMGILGVAGVLMFQWWLGSILLRHVVDWLFACVLVNTPTMPRYQFRHGLCIMRITCCGVRALYDVCASR